MFDGDKSRPMESLLFKNIAGRCGRAGQFTEGDTIIFDNPVGDAQLTSPARRPHLQRQIFFSSSQPVLESAMTRLGSEVAASTIGSQLLAAISENPGVEDLASSFSKLSFAYRTDGAVAAEERITQAFDEILDESEEQPLAAAASPVQLTPFGEAANSGGLSPGTARKLRKALNAFSDEGTSREDLINVGVRLLKELADVPEQSNPDLRKAVVNPRSYPIVRLDELELVLDLWLGGESLENIFATLPSTQRSRRRPGLQLWLEGVPEDSTWTDQFAKFYDFISNCVAFFLPWVLRAARPLAEIDNQPDRPWGEWAHFTELGLDSTWGVRLLAEDVVTERAEARIIGRELDALGSVGEPTSEQVHQALTEVLKDRDDIMGPLLSWYQQQGRSS